MSSQPPKPFDPVASENDELTRILTQFMLGGRRPEQVEEGVTHPQDPNRDRTTYLSPQPPPRDILGEAMSRDNPAIPWSAGYTASMGASPEVQQLVDRLLGIAGQAAEAKMAVGSRSGGLGVRPASQGRPRPPMPMGEPEIRPTKPAERRPMQPITSDEVTQLLEKWKEFGPEAPAPNPSAGQSDAMVEMAKRLAQERPVEPAGNQASVDRAAEAALAEMQGAQKPNEAEIRWGATPVDPYGQFNAAVELVRQSRNIAANLTGEPTARGTTTVPSTAAPVAMNMGDMIGINPVGFASTYVEGQPKTGAAALRARLNEIVPHEFGHGGIQAKDGTAALHQFESAPYLEPGEFRPLFEDAVAREPNTLKIGEQGNVSGRLPGEADMTVSFTPEEYMGLAPSTRRRFSLGDEVVPVPKENMVRGELLGAADARAASGSASEHEFQTKSESVRNAPEFQALVDKIVEKYARRMEPTRTRTSAAPAEAMPEPSDMVYPYANSAESGMPVKSVRIYDPQTGGKVAVDVPVTQSPGRITAGDLTAERVLGEPGQAGWVVRYPDGRTEMADNAQHVVELAARHITSRAGTGDR